VAPILYGLPGPELIEAAGHGDCVIGGCVVGPQEWTCLVCGYSWPLPPEALIPMVSVALSLAYKAHRDQVRKGNGTPYVDHPIAVAHMLFEAGYDPHVVAASLLHDAIEDGGFSAGEIADELGAPVASLAEFLTERKEIRDYERRKLEHRARVAGAGRRAVAIYAADKLANMRDLRAAYAAEGEAVGRRFNASLEEKLAQATRDVRMVKRVDPSNPFLDELMQELSELRADRTRGHRRLTRNSSRLPREMK
jgi:(p)ppGpp synthase/HD superfamily hydrolase